MAAFVLGNGLSRQEISLDQLFAAGAVYGCNALYRTHTPTCLVATDQQIAREIQESGYSSKHRFHTRRPLNGLGAQPVPKPYFGFSSGPIAAALAAMDLHPRVYLLGFDMGPGPDGKFNNIYAGTTHYRPHGAQPTFTGNWIKQLMKVCADYPQQEFVRVQGATTAVIPDLAGVTNLDHLPMIEFQARINIYKGP